MDRPDSNPKSAYGITKPPLHLIPSPALCRVSMVMKLGAQKYGAYNWRAESVAATVYVSAAQRHIAAWLDGEGIDEESGQPHIAHAAACLLILLDAQDNGKMVDDRPPAAVTGQLIRDLAVKPKLTGNWVATGWENAVPCPDCSTDEGTLHALDCPQVHKVWKS
jgi:hypothetical protein